MAADFHFGNCNPATLSNYHSAAKANAAA